MMATLSIFQLLLASLGLALLAGGFWWKRFADPAKGAAEIHSDAKKLNLGPHELAAVDCATFLWANHRYYNESEQVLTALKFQKAGDVEDLTLSQVYPQIRTFIRCMLSYDGAVSAGIYHFKIRGWSLTRWLALFRIIPPNQYAIDLETELSDGTFVTTSKTLVSDLSGPVPGIEQSSLPKETPIDDLLRTHRSAVARAIEARELTAVKLRTISDYMAMQHRLDAIKQAARREQGFVDLPEFDPCSAKCEDDESVAPNA